MEQDKDDDCTGTLEGGKRLSRGHIAGKKLYLEDSSEAPLSSSGGYNRLPLDLTECMGEVRRGRVIAHPVNPFAQTIVRGYMRSVYSCN